MKRLMIFLAAAMFTLASLSACNTMRGAGQDIEKAGEEIQEEADENQRY